MPVWPCYEQGSDRDSGRRCCKSGTGSQTRQTLRMQAARHHSNRSQRISGNRCRMKSPPDLLMRIWTKSDIAAIAIAAGATAISMEASQVSTGRPDRSVWQQCRTKKAEKSSPCMRFVTTILSWHIYRSVTHDFVTLSVQENSFALDNRIQADRFRDQLLNRYLCVSWAMTQIGASDAHVRVTIMGGSVGRVACMFAMPDRRLHRQGKKELWRCAIR